MKKLLIIVAVLLLSGCASTPYSSGIVDIRKTGDIELAKEYARLWNFQTTVWRSQSSTTEYNLALNEMKRRHPDWDWDAIVKRQIKSGMKPAAVIMVRGAPNRVNSRNGRGGFSEQWGWRYGKGRRYVYFDNNVVTSWEDS